MKDIEIAASSWTTPERVVTNDQLSQIMDTSDEWITERTGIKQRHLSTDENTSDLAVKVAQDLLTKADTQAEDLDLIIVATMSPDNMTPSTAAMVQGKIGAQKAVAFDLSAACSGFSFAFSVARDMMVANSWQKALVIGSEVLSKLIDWHDRSTAVLFGDGAGGVLLQASSEHHFLASDLRVFGESGDKLIAGHTAPQADYVNNSRQMTAFQMAGRDVYRFATHEVPNSLKRAADKASINLEQINHFLLHQANSRIITQVAKRLKQPLEKFPINIDEVGNTSAASEPILLAQCIEKDIVKQGDIIALSGFGGGLTTGTVIIKY
ncbi:MULTISPECIES: beta-ketoacyl-ACP synthase III [Lactobacillus]|uniref:Beta-ketoacyl-[acyl-carrier-protein] synthase III n=1 Tax=Lactobacillus xujianguonis TaxID=2495899 RepID=A0A437STX5_9LACO|nr:MULTISPECIES: beta-ketoacyl-ACP synthase III [Lactobacillus]RVU70324.1 ketoacyl-ACP synthase III [Lactobacillus xujianguonis]RVU76867.1 ketoacyl-ACP synthase III [Lactobacillus xujianguonis]